MQLPGRPGAHRMAGGPIHSVLFVKLQQNKKTPENKTKKAVSLTALEPCVPRGHKVTPGKQCTIPREEISLRPRVGEAHRQIQPTLVMSGEKKKHTTEM